MHILVTGGAGYLGTTLVPILLERNHRVTVFDSLQVGIGPLIPFFRHPGFSLVRGDVRDRQAVEAAVGGVEAVVHLAAIVGHPACARSPDEARAVNVEGTRNVAVAAGRGRPLVFASTSSVYGSVPEGVCTEDTPLRPVSLYGQTKAEGEAIVLQQADAIVCRIATCYGLSPRLRLDLLVNDFVWQALHRRRLTVYQGHFRRSFLHVSDAARAIVLALDRSRDMSGRVFNVGDESGNHTKVEICGLIARMIPDVAIETGSAAEDPDHRDYVVRYDRIRAAGFAVEWTLRDGVRELARALRWIDGPARGGTIL